MTRTERETIQSHGRASWILAIVAAAVFPGCRFLAPEIAARMVNGSITEYNKFLVKEKSDLLVWNIARTYYDRPTHFLQVNQLNTQFTAEMSGSIGGIYNSTGDPRFQVPLTVTGKGVVAPTITLTPLQGSNLAQYFLRPLQSHILIFWIWHPHDIGDTADTIKLVTAEFVVVEASGEKKSWVVRNRHGEADIGTTFPKNFTEIAERLDQERKEQNLEVMALDSSESPPGSKEPKIQETAVKLGKYALTNFPKLTHMEKRSFLTQMRDDPFHGSLIPVMLKDENVVIVKGYLRLRNIHDILHFVTDNIDNPQENICPLTVHKTSKWQDTALSIEYENEYFWISEDKRSRKAFNTLFLLLEANLSESRGVVPLLTLPVGTK